MIIKQSPEDFLVEELSLVEPTGSGEYIYFELEKENYTTARALQQIARRVGVSKKRFGFAGNKDKHAITKQVISVWNIKQEYLERVNLKDIKIKILGQGEERICLGDLKGNKFKIIIKEVSKAERERAKKNFESIKKNGFLNLFGEQRFGSSGNTHLIGKKIIDGDLEGAVKEFLVKSSENKEAEKFSKLAKKEWGDWKVILKECPDFFGLEKSVLNWLVQHPTDFAGALRTVTKPIRRLFVNAWQSWLWNKEAIKVKTKELEIPPIECPRMPELSTEGTTRQVIVKPKRFKIEYDTNLTAQFELPKGTYATVLIKELFRK